MFISIFDIFKIGIGPSSSHTVGPMRAANLFVQKLKAHGHFESTEKIMIELYGSLSATGIGHCTDKALIAGLEGHRPETIASEVFLEIHNRILEERLLDLDSKKLIKFDYHESIIFKSETLPYHSNGMIFYAYNQEDHLLYEKTFYSIGGGFIVGNKTAMSDRILKEELLAPYEFNTAKELLTICQRENKSISEIALANELAFRTQDEIDLELENIWKVMNSCIGNGLKNEGVLPGRMKVNRRAKMIFEKLKQSPEKALRDPLSIIDWVNLYALAVNEENASGGRVVTAPTNGAAGIIPAVLKYHEVFCFSHGLVDIKKFLLTAGTIGILFKKNASISGAEVGCQGEVGVASSMAAAGLTELLGGTPMQIENAAEISMEHHLGLTCDPVDGLVQLPCIERNAMGAVKAINASRIALCGNGVHFISLDSVMKTMKETGHDMQAKYKETSQGGLAVNVTEC